MEHAIHAHDLSKRYGEVQALDGTALDVEAGTLFALLGPNGAGKSTTVRILTTLAVPDRGTVRVAGLDALRDPAAVRRLIGVVGQRHGSDPQATGRENLALHGSLHGLHGRELRRRADELLDRFGLSAAADRPVRTYSGGMQRRLDVAIGLVHQPRVLFLDEPTTGLDPEGRRDVWHEIRGLAQERELTIFLTTHYLEEADEFADRLAIMDGGRIVVSGSPDELKRSLHGDSIRVQLEGDVEAPLVERALAPVEGIADVATADRAVRARARDGAAATPALLAALQQAGIGVVAVTVARPSLDDVYLRHAGREFATALEVS
jgi:ABC-2 type transport system ATP-binding protein